MKEAKIYIKAENNLGESPVWDHRNNQFLWVDIESRILSIYDTNSKEIVHHEMNSRVSALAITDIPNVYLVALQSGLKLYDAKKQTFSIISNPEKKLPNNRFNDGKCDSEGRFWIGSMDLNAIEGAGNLYSLLGDGQIMLKLDKLSIPNGLAWSPDNKYMYFVDSINQVVLRFDFDVDGGNISNAKKIIQVPQRQGVPDGMCIDHEGMLWIAHWGGSNVSRWNPETGSLVEQIGVAAKHVTSCCFGGEEMDTLLITSARYGLNEAQLAKDPLSGSVFSCHPGVTGPRFKLFSSGKKL